MIPRLLYKQTKMLLEAELSYFILKLATQHLSFVSKKNSLPAE